jgi:hypothetical protein
MAFFRLFALSDDGHLTSVGNEYDFAEARFQAERVANFSPTGTRVRIYLDGLHVMEVRGGVTQPSLWHSGEWI